MLATLRLSILISRHASSLSKSAEGFQTSLGIMLALLFLSDLEFIHRLAKVGFGMRFFPFWCSDFQGWFREIFLCDFLCFGFGIGFCSFCFVRVLVKVKRRYWVFYSLIFAFITCGAFSRLPNGDWSVFSEILWWKLQSWVTELNFNCWRNMVLCEYMEKACFLVRWDPSNGFSLLEMPYTWNGRKWLRN